LVAVLILFAGAEGYARFVVATRIFSAMDIEEAIYAKRVQGVAKLLWPAVLI
tara:strand:- start:138 stop:293 length:156 start_codon:yes stop_codon:yes gene_type:complete